MADDVTPGEMVRRLDSISSQLQQIVTQLGDMSRHSDATFMRKDVLDSRLATVNTRIDEAEKDIEDVKEEAEKDIEDVKKALAAQQDRNRQLVIALIVVAIPSIVSIVLAVLGTQGSVG